MSTFNKLSLLAQYDDVCRLVNTIIDDNVEVEQFTGQMFEGFRKLWHQNGLAHGREIDDLKGEISDLKREIKKLNRQLAESRAALVRETDEKRTVAKERKALMDQIRQVRQLVERDGLGNSDAHRKRVIKCLDIERLSPIQSDDSDDCVSGLDYDKTEEDILDPAPEQYHRRVSSRRNSNNNMVFDDALESLPNTEQPTLLYRFLDKDNNADDLDEPITTRRSSRRGATANHHSSSRHRSPSSTNLGSAPTTTTTTTSSSSNTNYREKFNADQNTETDSNGMETNDDYDIEQVRQQLQRYEAEKRENLASTNSTPNIKNKIKSATLSAKSAANLMKTVSNINTPVSNTLKPHTFTRKKSFKPDNCGPCGGKISFYGNVVKCEVCGVISHPDCKDKCPLPCVKITAPNTRSRSKKILISDYVNNDAIPKVPAIIVHCCNEIERDDNIIIEGLYRVVARTSDIEDLQEKILKSKSGMPNLSRVDVHLLTGVVKRFLQGLDESLMTTTLWSHFSEATRLESDLETITHFSFYISNDLPTANRDTLAYLMQHLHAIAKHSDQNMMTTKNLAKTLAPTIVGNSCRNAPPQTILHENKVQIQIMETLFRIEEDFWSKFVHKSTPPKSTAASSLGSRLLGTPSSSFGVKTRSSRLGGTLPTPKLKPLFS